MDETRPRLARMFAHGTTTAEAKTGYGLESETELRMLQAILALDAAGPLELAPTFLGAHAIPPEYKDEPQAYTDLLCAEMLPFIRQWWQSQPSTAARPLPFVDVFCETGAFRPGPVPPDLDQGQGAGFPAQAACRRVRQPGRCFAGCRTGRCLGRPSGENLRWRIFRRWLPAIPSPSRCPAPPLAWPKANIPLPGRSSPPVEFWRWPATAIPVPPGASPCSSSSPWPAGSLKLTPAQAIAAATINAAHAIRRHDRIGSLEPGKQADLLILSVPDYRHLGYRFGTNLVRQVIKRGQVYPVQVEAGSADDSAQVKDVSI